MTAKDLTLVVVASSPEDARRFDWTHCNAAETVLVINYPKAALSQIANRFHGFHDPLFRRPFWERCIFGLCHADVIFGPGALDALAKCAGAGAVCGVVGMNPDLKEGAPGANPGANRQNQRWGEVWAYQNPGRVSTLDSAAVFFRRDSGLRFDAMNFDGMHCHVEDLCLQAHAKGIPVVVPAADATHIGNPGLQSWDDWWHSDYRKYRQRLGEKWAGVRFGTT